MKKKGLAVFDLDGTITKKDTFIEFIRFVHGSITLYLGMLLQLPYIGLFYLKLYPNNRLKERVFAYFFQNYSIEKLTELGVTFCKDKMPKICYSKALERLKWHQQQEHDIVILTASADIWLKEWCVEHQFVLISSIYETKEGCFTGKLEGENCYGIEKVKRLQQQFDLENYAFTYGYGDSPSDQYFLELMDKFYYKNFK